MIFHNLAYLNNTVTKANVHTHSHDEMQTIYSVVVFKLNIYIFSGLFISTA